MSQAEDLLNSLADSIPEHEHPVVDSDTYFVIDPISRIITNTAQQKNVLMQYDHLSERFTFELPRYVEGHDMTLCNSVLVHWINLGEDGKRRNAEATDITDLQINPNDHNTVICSWLISRNSTQLAGALSFLVQYKCVDSEGNVSYEWHTDIYSDIEIKAGRNNSEGSVIQYTDILEQWRAQLFGAGDSVIADIVGTSTEEQAKLVAESKTQQSAIESKGAEILETIPDDYTELYGMSSDAIRTRANAIVQKVEGEVIAASDCSDDYLRGLRIFGKSTQVSTTGKNLLNNELYSMTANGISITVNTDKSFVVNGTATDGVFLTLHTDFNPGAGDYILSGCPSSGGSGKYILYMTDDSGFYVQDAGTGGTTFTHPGDIAPEVRVAIYKGTTLYGVRFEPMIRRASITDSTYEFYTGGVPSPSPEWPQEIMNIGSDGETDVWITGKNLLRDINAPVSHSHNGLTCDYEGNGVFHVHGTFNGVTGGTQLGTTTMNMPIDPKSQYTFSAKVLSGTVPDDFHPYISASSDTISFKNWLPVLVPEGAVAGEVFTATLPATSTVPDATTIKSFWLYTHNDYLEAYTADFRVQLWLERSNVSTGFESYTEQLYTVSMSNGLPGLPVTSGGNYTDDGGQQWICDEIDFERGVYIQRVGYTTFDGSEGNWSINTYNYNQLGVYIFGHNIPNIVPEVYDNPIMCDKFQTQLWGYLTPNNRNKIYSTPNYVQIFLEDQTITDSTMFETWLASNPIIVYYPLKTPIETPLTDEEIFNFSQLHSNYPNTMIFNDSKAHMTVKYNADTQLYFNNSRGASDEQVERYVNAWLEANFTSAEGVSF